MSGVTCWFDKTTSNYNIMNIKNEFVKPESLSF